MRHDILLRARRDPVLVGAGTTLVVLLVLVLVVPLVNPTDINAPRLDRALQAPSWIGGDGGLFGTDQLGRSVALLVVYGLRTSFLIGIAGVLVGCVIGTAVGLLAGYHGGWIDAALMRFADVQLSFPALLLAMTIVGLIGGGITPLILVLGISGWMLYARVVRGTVLSIRSTDLVTSARGLGASSTRIIARHVLPNVTAPIVALMTLEFARVALAEAALSFLGFGVSAPQISLGAVLSSGRDFIQSQWWIATFSGLVLSIAVLSTNLVGSWLQEAFDPTLVGREE